MLAARSQLTGLGLLVLASCYSGLPQGAGAEDEGRFPEGADNGDGDGDDDGDDGDDGDGGGEEEADPPPMHRLNRLEYNNTVRDLLGTALRPADAFPPDAEANGFDNMAEQLNLSAGLLDRYVAAAAEVVDEALSDRPIESVLFVGEEVGAPAGYPVGELWALAGQTATMPLELEHQGTYRVSLDLGAIVVGPAPTPLAVVAVDGIELTTFAVEGSAAHPASTTLDVDLAPGAHTLSLRQTNFVNNPVANDANNIVVASVEVQSHATAPGPGRALVYHCDPDADGVGCAEQIIGRFAARAWRRPISDDELDGLLALHDSLLVDGESAEDALRLVLRTVMSSPKFFYRIQVEGPPATELDPYVLASRLSYFLWSSMPDDVLFDAADDGSLTSDAGLSSQVARMLADPRAHALVDGFADQWLSTRRLEGASPNPAIYPNFDEDLRAAMVAESHAFFGDYLTNGLPVGSMLLPEFAHRNDRLAQHYGEPLPGSSELQRVLVADDQRRGMLMLSGWLTSTSDSNHSSPIRRGAWVSDRLLCQPVPPPPPGVAFDPIALGRNTTVREQLEAHRSDPTCASCHALLDVLGIGFEEFDGIGTEAWPADLDNLGELPDGRTFEGAQELATYYLESEAFVGCVTQKLMTYALGRALGPDDAASVHAITSSVSESQAGLGTLVDEIVHTPEFRSPKGNQGP